MVTSLRSVLFVFCVAVWIVLFALDANAQYSTWLGVDSSEKVHSTLKTPIGSGDVPPFKVKVATGDGQYFAKALGIAHRPIVVTLAPAPAQETPLTAIEEVIVDNVVDDSLTISYRPLSNTHKNVWVLNSYIGIRMSYVTLKQLQDSLRLRAGQIDSLFGIVNVAGLGLPSQTGNNGKVLTTNGSSLSWTLQPGSVVPVSLGGLNMTTIASGKIPYGQSANVYGQLALGTGLSIAGGILSTSLAPFSTSNLVEGTNLYYTNARVLALVTGTPPVNVTGGAITVDTASATTTGVVTSGDWNNFNSKQNALSLPLSIANGGTGQTTKDAALNALLPDSTGFADSVVLGKTHTGYHWVGVAGGGGAGTVTSAALTMPAIFSVSGSPITTSGTFAVTLANESANLVFSGPSTGSPAAPTFRALVSADIPNLSAAKVTSGTLAVAQGGTNSGTALSGSSIMISNGSAVVQGTAGTTTQVLHGNASGAPTYGAIVNADITNGTIDLTAKVTGILPAADGGTANGFTAFTGPASTTKTFTLPDASATILTDNAAVTIAQGGTGQTTANAALNALLPTQTGNNGKVLSTNGSNTSWTTTLTNPMTTAGDIIIENNTPAPARLGIGSSNQVLGISAGLPAWATLGVDGSLVGNGRGTAFGINLTNSNIFAAAQTVDLNGIAATYTTGVTVGNTTASSSGTHVQQSPSIELDAHVWNTTSTAADSLVNVLITDVPTSGTTTGGKLRIDFGNAGAGFSNVWSVSDLGVQNVTGKYQIGGTDVLSSTTLGSSVVNSSLTSLGTIATGVWHGTIVGALYGGTGLDGSAAANGSVPIGNGSGFTLATVTAGSGISVTNGAGSITIAATAGITNPMTTTGDIIFSSDNSGTAARLGIGASTTVLHGGTTPSYSQIVNGDIANATIANAKLANSTIGLTNSDGSLTITGSAISLGGSGTVTLALGHSNTFTAAQEIDKNNIKTTYTAGVTLGNTTASDATNTVQQAPSLIFDAHGWSTAATAADSELKIRITDVPVSASNATSKLAIDFGNDALGFTNEWSLTSAGVVNIGSKYQIGGTDVLSSSTLGSGITASSLTSVGTITSGTWHGSAIDLANYATGTLAVANGGSGQSSYTDGQLLIGNTTGNTLAKATLTAGTNITITNGHGTITIGETAASLTNPMTTTGDIIFSSDNSGTPGRRAIGSLYQVLVGGTTPAYSNAIERDAIGATSTDGWVLTNTTAAANGAQQYSPRIRLTGQGWKTNSTAASETVDWIIENRPQQGSSVPASQLVFSEQTNGSGYNDILTLAPINTIGSNEMYIGSTGAQVQDIYFGYGKSGGGGTTSTLHATNGTGSNNPGANLALSAGLGTGTQLSGEFDFIGNFTGSTGSGLNSTRTLMKLVPSGAAASTAKATLTIGIGSTADGNIVINNVTNGNAYTIVPAAPSAARTLTIPDPGGAASFVMTAGAQTLTGALSVTGGFNIGSPQAQAANYTTIASDYLVSIDATTGAVTVTLTASPTAGQKLWIYKKDNSANHVIFSGNTGQSIIGTTSDLTSQGDSRLFVYVSSNTWLAK